MIRIYVKKRGQDIGKIYKAKTSVLQDKVAILSYIGFVLSDIITEDEWAKSQQTIADRFGLQIVERQFDGRKKIAKSVPYFNWSTILKK